MKLNPFGMLTNFFPNVLFLCINLGIILAADLLFLLLSFPTIFFLFTFSLVVSVSLFPCDLLFQSLLKTYFFSILLSRFYINIIRITLFRAWLFKTWKKTATNTECIYVSCYFGTKHLHESLSINQNVLIIFSYFHVLRH